MWPDGQQGRGGRLAHEQLIDSTIDTNYGEFILLVQTLSWSLFSATQFWRSKVLDVAKDFPEYTFAIADEEDYAEELKSLGLSESGEEVNVGILADGGKKFAMEPEELDSEVLRDFVIAYKKGECRLLFYYKKQILKDVVL